MASMGMVATSSYMYLAGEVVGIPLDGHPPDGLHGHGDAGYEGVRKDELEHKEVDVSLASEA